MKQIRRYDIFELVLNGPMDGNPYLDVQVNAQFQYKNRLLEIEGFHDGDGVFRVRIMPDEVGEWRYMISSNLKALDGIAGVFECTPARPGVHGPVRAADRFHFAYADGARYVPFGTTCYAWAHQGELLETQTLETLRGGYFNKLRMCIFPKDYAYNKNEPDLFPFERTGQEFHFDRPNPDFWRHFEKLVGQLCDLGIEADLILFHPYDRWGFQDMGKDNDDRYLRYIVARLSAYRNVWWSFANEYDAMKTKNLQDWDRLFALVQRSDPHQHLRGLHNMGPFYDHSKGWVTHCSVQHWDTQQIREWRERYGKPVVVDECGYEGDIVEGWGNFNPQEHLSKFWRGVCRGGYVGHGETYYTPDEVLWWSKGGVLRGQTPERIRFLRQIIEEAPAGLEPVNDWAHFTARCGNDYFLIYLDAHQPRAFAYDLPEGDFQADIIDTWEMKITPVYETIRGRMEITLPAKPHLAVRVRRVS